MSLLSNTNFQPMNSMDNLAPPTGSPPPTPHFTTPTAKSANATLSGTILGFKQILISAQQGIHALVDIMISTLFFVTVCLISV